MSKKYDTNPRVEVATSAIHGRGLFARKAIANESFIGTYAGKRTQKNGMHVLWIWNEENDRWEGVEGDNEMRFLNHSGHPNAEFFETDLYAIADIKVGDEITFDYQWDEAEPET